MKKKTALPALIVALTTISFNSCFAQENWIARVRGLHVKTDIKSTVSPIGGGISVNSDQVPEFDITKFLTNNIAAELILATTKHDVSARGTSLGNLGLGSVKLLPPTLTLQYHANPTGTFRPYAGAGLNYTVFYGAKNGGAATSLSYQNHIGYAFQAGFDYMIDEKVGVNFDIKKIFLQTHAIVNDSISAKVRLDPWLIGAGVSYHF